MTHAQVASYLGNEDRLSAYTIVRGPDGYWVGFYIQYENGKARKWRMMQGFKHNQGEWCDVDAVWTGLNVVTGPDGKPRFYVPKSML